MNNLVQIREKIKKEERLRQARLLATKNGFYAPYKRSIYQDRINEVRKNIDRNWLLVIILEIYISILTSWIITYSISSLMIIFFSLY